MKSLAITAAVASAFAAQAFDSADWLGKREMLDREAERLRGVYSNCVASLKIPAENITVPIENHPDGSVKSKVFAEKAQFFIDDGLVWGEGVKVSQFDESGREVGSVSASSCVVDKQTKSGWAEGAAKVVYGNTVVEGDGVYFSFAEEYIKITSKTCITSKELKFGGFKL